MATVLDRLPPGARCTALVEVADRRARQRLGSRADLDLRWLVREGGPAGSALVRAVREQDWDGEPPWLWAGGESAAMREIRTFLREEAGLPRERAQVVGYWKAGLDEDEAIEAHLAATDAVREAGGGEDELENARIY